MWIKQVELRNIKSYSDPQTIRFAEGINAICGRNGAGKSTILEAVGLALFDVSPYRPKNLFVREGVRQGEVIVTIIDALDDREYQIVCPVGGGQSYIYDPEINKKLIAGKEDVLQWLREHLGISQTADLNVLFTDAVGVPQGLLTTPFLETRASERKKKFNPLLQVDEYEAVWNQLLETDRYVRDERARLKEGIAALSGKLERLPNLQQEHETLTGKLKASQEDLEELTSHLEKITQKKEELDKRKETLTTLQQQVTTLGTQLKGLQQQVAESETDVQQAQAAQQIVEAAKQGHEAYKATQSRLSELESKRQARDDLRHQLSVVEKELAAINQEITNYESRLVDITTAENRLTELTPLVTQQEQLEYDLQAAQKQVTELQNVQSRLIDEQERLEKLKLELSQVENGLRKRRALEEGVAALSEEIKQFQAKSDNLSDDLEELGEEKRAADNALKEAEQHLRDWREAQSKLHEEQDKLQKLQEYTLQIEEQLVQRQTLEEQVAALEERRQEGERKQAQLHAEEPLVSNQQQELEKRLSMLQQTESAKCPVCQEPLSAEHAAKLIEQYQTEQSNLVERFKNIQSEKQALEQSISQIAADQQQFNQQLATFPNSRRLEETNAEIEQQVSRVGEQEERLLVLSDAPQKEEAAKVLFQKIESQENEARQKQEEIRQTLSEMSQRLADTQTQIAQLSHPDRAQEVLRDIQEQETTIAGYQEKVLQLEGAPEAVTKRQEQLKDLGNPHQEYQRTKAKADERAGTEEKLNQAQAKQNKRNKSKSSIEADIKQYENLDEDIAKQQELLARYEVEHNRYVQNLQMAEMLPTREVKLAKLRQDMGYKKVEYDQVNTNLNKTKANYDEERHHSLTNEYRQLGEEKATLNERLNNQINQLAAFKKEIDALLDTQKKLEVSQQEELEWASLAEAMTFIRNTIREAGPHITRRLVQAISLEANQIFGDIMADHTMQLEWDEDYAITVTHQGEGRVFQQLSGGEQMAAALAVRLALLRQMTEIRIAFFDEPTAHLDEERRTNLAEQITRIKGFRQLFVISHDDTFERATHHVLRITKESDVSKVSIG